MAKVTITWAWVATAVTYDIQYKKSVDSVWIPAPGSPLGNPVSGPNVDMQIDSLDTNTMYDFRVRSNCAGGYQSAWSEQSKSTNINMNVTISMLTFTGATGSENIADAKFSVGGIDSGYVLPAPIPIGGDESFQLQASAGYQALITISNGVGGGLDGSLRAYVNSVLFHCVLTEAAGPTAITLNFNSAPGDNVLIVWTEEPCDVP